MEKASRTSPAPAMAMNPAGTVKVHFTMPIPLRKKAVRGLMIREFIISPVMVESRTAGMKLSAVCRMSCLVVKPSAFMIP